MDLNPNNVTDQNLEPKTSIYDTSSITSSSSGGSSSTDPPFTPISPRKLNMYLLGAVSPQTLIGHVDGGMTDVEIEEYITMQRRLAPPSFPNRGEEHPPSPHSDSTSNANANCDVSTQPTSRPSQNPLASSTSSNPKQERSGRDHSRGYGFNRREMRVEADAASRESEQQFFQG